MIRAAAFAIEGVLSPSSFVVPRGRLALLAGASGSGKSLLLRALAGFAPPFPHAGRLLVSGLDPLAAGPAAAAARVALVFQDAAERLPQPTVRAALAARLENAGVPRADGLARVEAALARLGLPPERSTAALSEGEAKRVAIEAALAAAPDVLLLDEPLASLDAGSRRRVLARLAEAKATAAILVAEHRVAEVASIADLRLDIADRAVREAPRVVA